MRTSWLLAVGLAAIPLPAGAQGALGDGVGRVEERVDAALGETRRRLEEVPLAGELARRIDVSASWLGAYYDTQPDSQITREQWSTWDARYFVDALLAENLALGERRLVNAVGASFEWELFRVGEWVDDLGELYLDLQGLGGSPWLNVQLGRFQIPVGENYLRFGKGYRDNPFLSNTVGGPWWWDEGVRVHGADARQRFGYVASFTNGDTARTWNFADGDQMTLKLFVNPASWLHLSASALHAGPMGRAGVEADTALWLGEMWAHAFGGMSWLPNFADGVAVPDGPPRLDRTLYLGADAVLTHPAGARLWLSYGSYEIDSRGGSLYDRRLHTWVAELVLEGRLVSPELRAFYVALRANGLGTYDRDEGYFLDIRYIGALGWNMRSLDAYSLGAGWRVTKWTTLKLEYSFQDVELVRGARSLSGERADRADYFGAGLGIHF